MRSFDSPVSKAYVSRCISLVESIASRTEPPISGLDLVSAIQEEVPIPTTISGLPPNGILGLCVNLITIVRHDEEDPVELIMRVLKDEGV
jgi:hypothetical protein